MNHSKIKESDQVYLPPYLEELNSPQRESVQNLKGPVLMLAGAGTGKTKALTARFVHLLKTGNAHPNEIFAVTFTNKAAMEMKYRVGSILNRNVEGFQWLGTFHSVCARLLRKHAELVGLESNFTILDSDDQLRILKQLIKLENIDEKNWPPRLLASIIDNWKNKAFTPQNLPSVEHDKYDGKGCLLYSQYQQRLTRLNACDFGDLLLKVVIMFQENSAVLQKYHKTFKYILVDEYQDTNVVQYLLLRLLAADHQNICCVGDDDQSIYGWRGAEVKNILRFESDFKNAKIIRLEQNYRSTEYILKAATGIISSNRNRLGKTLWTGKTGGELVRLIGNWDGEAEATWISDEIEAMQVGTRSLRKYNLNEIAVLVRASHQMRAFEDRFLKIGLNYRVIGGPRFYERLEIRDAISYFRLLISSKDDLAFERIINTPKRGLGDSTIQKIHLVSRATNSSLFDGAKEILRSNKIKGKGAIKLASFVNMIDRLSKMYRNGEMSHTDIAAQVLEESGYTDMWTNLKDKSPDAGGRLENLKELIKALEDFENLEGFLEHVALIMENNSGNEADKVSIMTLHASKGLEFPSVFLPGWEDGLFPSQRSMDESGEKGLEEERRLAYVGITRAEELCTISFVGSRQIYGQWQSSIPSRFINDIPLDCIENLTQPGLYGYQLDEGSQPTEMDIGDIQDRASKADIYDSPGWKRLQNTKRDQTAQNLNYQANKKDLDTSFCLDDKVFHQKFGYGVILTLDGENAEVFFEKAGEKKLRGPLSKYLTICINEDNIET
ncbi:MAG: ATP-dependent helicase [Paracoccaceae bacterium]